jgi:hypothetical protein
MKSTVKVIIIVFILFDSQFILSQTTPRTCMVTYIANEGFLIEASNYKIIIDGLFRGIKGNEVLSAKLPKTLKEIEKIMTEKSRLTFK